MAGSGRILTAQMPSRLCARLYYCQTRVSTRCRLRHEGAPLPLTGRLPPKSMSTSSRVRIGRVSVDRMSLEEMLGFVTTSLSARSPKTVFYANSYAVTLAEADPPFAAAMGKADVVFCDGFGVYVASRVLGSSVPQRFAWPDWIERLAAVCRDTGA